MGKVPLFVIIAVIIFILVIVIVLSSLEVKDQTVKQVKTRSKISKKVTFNDVNISAINIEKISDSLVFEFNDLSSNISYIFGSEFDNSSISVYKEISENKFELLYSKVYTGNNGIVLSSNALNVNASYFQIGTKLKLENTKYNTIPLLSNCRYKVAVNNCTSNLFKVYRYTINYSIQQKDIPEYKGENIFGLSEYDLEFLAKSIYPDIQERVLLKRNSKELWKFNEQGDYVLFYIKNLYNFKITDELSYDGISNEILSSKDMSKSPVLEKVILKNPNLTIKNLDENIPIKNFNSDFILFINTPFSLYDHFLYGPKHQKDYIVNRISNKILIFKI
jgi:hypothetical protein